jgi:hypothetical protein
MKPEETERVSGKFGGQQEERDSWENAIMFE